LSEERDILVKRIFPQLKELSEERSLAPGRSGPALGQVTDKQKAERKALSICPGEVKT
jgi:hypothetical protein